MRTSVESINNSQMFNFAMQNLGKKQKKKKNGSDMSPKVKETAQEPNDDLNW